MVVCREPESLLASIGSYSGLLLEYEQIISGRTIISILVPLPVHTQFVAEELT